MPAQTAQTGQIVILNGTPRSGKSSIAKAIQDTVATSCDDELRNVAARQGLDGVWMNLGVDAFKAATPDRFQPGIGLRPGGERPDLEPVIVDLYRAMYESIAAHSRVGVNVVVDVGHHDWYSEPRHIFERSAQLLSGLPVLIVGVRCPLDVVMQRLTDTWGTTLADDGSVPAPIRRWHDAVHRPGIYDLEVNTSKLSPHEAADVIRDRLKSGPPSDASTRLAEAARAHF